MGAYLVSADVSFAITGSATHTRSSAFGTTDDPNKPGVSYTYDGGTRRHGHFASIPGTVALSVTAGRITPLHEFGHAASDWDNGLIDDLYVDALLSVSDVNKKARAKSTDSVPAAFANYKVRRSIPTLTAIPSGIQWLGRRIIVSSLIRRLQT